MSEIENAYWAGIIDGEGCISVQRDNRGLRKWFGYIALVNTSQLLCETYRTYFGIQAKLVVREWERGKTSYQIRSTGEEAKRIIRMISPYLIIKKTQAELVSLILLYPENRIHYGHGMKILRQIRKLNRRGKTRQM